MALPRDATVSLLHHHGISMVASQLRNHRQHLEQAIVLVLGTTIPHAWALRPPSGPASLSAYPALAAASPRIGMTASSM